MGTNSIYIDSRWIEQLWVLQIEIVIYLLFGFAVFVAFYAKKIIKDKKIRTLINIVFGGLLAAPILKNKLYMDAQIITTLGGLATMTLGYVFREWSNAKARKQKEKEQSGILAIKEAENKKELTTRDKLISNRLQGLEDSMLDVKMMLKDMQDDTDFKNVLKNSIRNSTENFVNINRTMADCFKNILMDYAKITENISLRWNKAEFRGAKNRIKMEKYLKNYLKSNLKNTDNLINNSIPSIKKLSDHDLRGCLFSDFIKKNGLYNEFELLIMALAQNGFNNDEEIIEKFTDFIDRLFTKFADLVTIWNLPDKKAFNNA